MTATNEKPSTRNFNRMDGPNLKLTIKILSFILLFLGVKLNSPSIPEEGNEHLPDFFFLNDSFLNKSFTVG